MPPAASSRTARVAILAASLALAVAAAGDGAAAAGAGAGFRPRTAVSIEDGFWRINGKPTYPGSQAEGLLILVRMANAIFDDLNAATRPAGFDAAANTKRFVASIPRYREAGVAGFVVSLQGGDPGYAGALCSAFEPDGSLRADFLERAAAVIEACDHAGMVVVLGLFNRWQDQVLESDAAVEKGVAAVMRWIGKRGYRNVLVEIADEYTAPGYDRAVFKSPEKMGALVKLARKSAPGVLVSSNRLGTGRVDPAVGNVSDYLSTHFTRLPVKMIQVRAVRVMVYNKPIVCTADVRPDDRDGAALEAAIDALCSYGITVEKNERYPFRYDGPGDAPGVFRKLRRLTTPGEGE